MFSLKKNKNHLILLAAFFAFAGFLFFPGGIAHADVAEWTIDPILRAVRAFVVMLLSMSTSLFGWIINVENFNKIIANNGALYEIWKQVRDVLNVAFILVLLFSAFSTIFQVEKYNYKKILLNLVIMALLVNFSFPITRFIIDISNVMMYTFVNNLPWGNGAEKSLIGIADNSGMAEILKGMKDAKEPTEALLAQIVFGFILAVTLLSVGILFIVRIIALSLIIVFSPIAFVGSILPDTSGKSSQWWGYLFQYSFFGPVMMFVIYIATKFMEAMAKNNSIFTQLATEQSQHANLVGNMAMFSIPIVLLWMGMGVAQSMSIAGASTVMGGAQKFAKWAGSGSYKIPKMFAKATGIPGGVQQSWKKNVTDRFDRSQKNREAWVAGKLGDKGAAERNMKTRSAEYEKNNETIDDLKKWAANGDAAAAYSLATRGKMDPTTFKAAMDTVKDAKTKDSLMGKTEETRMDVTLKYKYDINAAKAVGDPTKKAWANIQDVAMSEYGNLTAEAWAKQKNLAEQFDPAKNPHAAETEAGAKAAFGTLHPTARTEAFKRMNGSNAAAIV